MIVKIHAFGSSHLLAIKDTISLRISKRGGVQVDSAVSGTGPEHGMGSLLGVVEEAVTHLLRSRRAQCDRSSIPGGVEVDVARRCARPKECMRRSSGLRPPCDSDL